jgi:hypothetical protein
MIGEEGKKSRPHLSLPVTLIPWSASHTRQPTSWVPLTGMAFARRASASSQLVGTVVRFPLDTGAGAAAAVSRHSRVPPLFLPI